MHLRESFRLCRSMNSCDTGSGTSSTEKPAIRALRLRGLVGCSWSLEEAIVDYAGCRSAMCASGSREWEA